MSLEEAAFRYTKDSNIKNRLTFIDGAAFAGHRLREEESVNLIADEFRSMFYLWYEQEGDVALDWESAAKFAVEEVLRR